MGFFQKLARFLSPPRKTESSIYRVHARCSRCGEELSARVNLYHEFSLEYDGERPYYHCRKVLMGEGHCFQKVEMWLTFDQDRQLSDRQISGGTFFEPEEKA